MGERSFETPRHFADYVVRPNLTEFNENTSSLKAAFNSIMSIDALVGQIFEQQKRMGIDTAKNDSDFRNDLAGENENFQLVRDVAKSFKHTSLDRGDPLVQRADQTGVGGRSYGASLYGVGSFDGEEVMVKTNNGDEKHLLSVATEAFTYLETKIKAES